MGVEPLEDRFTPAVITWTGTVNNLWNVAGNWSLNRTPQAGDDLMFDASGMNLNTVNNLNINGVLASLWLDSTFNGSIQVNVPNFQVVSVTHQNGTFAGTHSMTIVNGAQSGMYSWTGGSLGDGTGQGFGLVINPNVTMNISGAQNKTINKSTLFDYGRVNWSGTGQIREQNGSSFIVGSGATFTASGSGDFSGLFDSTNTLLIAAGGSYIQTNGASTFISAAVTSAGRFEVNGETIVGKSSSMSGTIVVSGTFVLEAGSLNTWSSVTETGAGTVMLNGFVWLTVQNTVTIANLFQNDGVLDGAGTLIITGSYDLRRRSRNQKVGSGNGVRPSQNGVSKTAPARKGTPCSLFYSNMPTKSSGSWVVSIG